jgi:hypothetical protein
MIRRGALLALVLGAVLIGRCASTPSPPEPANATRTPPGYLVVLLRAEYPSVMSKVEIVDLSGKLVASAAFNAPSPVSPSLGCGVVVPPAVRVADGAAYFVDSTGTIRRLDPKGVTAAVTTLKLPSQQPIISFAVSPDGNSVIAILLDVTTQGGTLDLENATAGTPATIAFHRSLASPPAGATEIVGWDGGGPTATLDSRLCVQQAPPSLEYTGSQLIHLASDGTHLDVVGGPDCLPWDELPDGTVLCGSQSWNAFEVRTRDGRFLWGANQGLYDEPRLSPDGHAVAFNQDALGGSTAVVITPTGSRPSSDARAMAPRYSFLGWAGNEHLVVVTADGHLALLTTEGPGALTDLGLALGNPCVGCGSQRVSLIGTIGIA